MISRVAAYLRSATRLSAALASAASLSVTSPIASDAALPRHQRAGGVSLVRKKDGALASSRPAGPEPTLGTLFNTHSTEAVPLSDAEPEAARFSAFLGDTAMQARVDMAPELLGVLRAIGCAHPGARIDIVSGYRSAKRNEMMRKKGRNVASHSQHTLGRAVDFRVEGLGVLDIVKEVEALRWTGGIGRYDSASDRFVHVDVGPNRRWKGR